MKRIFGLLIALVMVLGLSAQAYATLTTIGTATYGSSDYNLIYDNDLGVTWLDYSNPVNTWGNQVSWAAGLNTTGVLTYNLNPGITMSWSGDWRLPSALNQDGSGPDKGWVTGSEMGHLYYTELGNPGRASLTYTGPFTNLQRVDYWSGTEYSLDPLFIAWFFDFDFGYQDYDGKGGDLYAWAVRPGDVVSAPVPEPATMLLLGSGLVGLAGLRKKFKK